MHISWMVFYQSEMFVLFKMFICLSALIYLKPQAYWSVFERGKKSTGFPPNYDNLNPK